MPQTACRYLEAVMQKGQPVFMLILRMLLPNVLCHFFGEDKYWLAQQEMLLA